MTNHRHTAPKQTVVLRAGIVVIAEIVATATSSMPRQNRLLNTLPSRKLPVATPLNAMTLRTGATNSSVQTAPLTTQAPKNPPRVHLPKVSLVMAKVVAVAVAVAAVVAGIVLSAKPERASSRVLIRGPQGSTAHLHAVNSDVLKPGATVAAAAIVGVLTIAVVSPWGPVARGSGAIRAPDLRHANPPTAPPPLR